VRLCLWLLEFHVVVNELEDSMKIKVVIITVTSYSIFDAFCRVSQNRQPQIEKKLGISNDALIGNECQHIQRVVLTKQLLG